MYDIGCFMRAWLVKSVVTCVFDMPIRSHARTHFGNVHKITERYYFLLLPLRTFGCDARVNNFLSCIRLREAGSALPNVIQPLTYSTHTHKHPIQKYYQHQWSFDFFLLFLSRSLPAKKLLWCKATTKWKTRIEMGDSEINIAIKAIATNSMLYLRAWVWACVQQCCCCCCCSSLPHTYTNSDRDARMTFAR